MSAAEFLERLGWVVLHAAWIGLVAAAALHLVLHELEHVRRRDPWVAHVQVVVQALFAFHPGVRWISHQVRLEREASCDASVVRVTGDHRAYARALLHLADFVAAVRPATLLAATGGDLVIRIRRLSGLRAAVAPRSVAVSFAGLAAACTLGAAFASMPPRAADDPEVSHPYLNLLRTPALRGDEHGAYFVVSSRRQRDAGGVELGIESRYYPATRQARFVVRHTNLEQRARTLGVRGALLTLRRGDTVIFRTILDDVVTGHDIPRTIVGTPLLDSRFMDDLSGEDDRTTRLCAQFELKYATDTSFATALIVCDRPLIVPPAGALPLPRSELATERDASIVG